MKKYEAYKDIRKQALIFGLPLGFFILQIVSILIGFFVLFTAFSLLTIIGLVIFWVGLYAVLGYLTKNPSLFNFSKIFPNIITNKSQNTFNYEED